MNNTNERFYEFGRFRFELRRGRLLRDGEPVRLPAKAAETLRVLLERRGRTVGREELLEAVWSRTTVEDANLTVAVSTLRKVLGPRDGAPWIETIPRIGYRFTADSETAGLLPDSQASVPPANRPSGQPRHFVGRNRERAQLHQAFERARTGRGSLLCIAGEAGIGKTALVEDFLAELDGQRIFIARGRCSERLAGADAYLPWLESLESLLSADRLGISRVMHQFAPTWHGQLNADDKAWPSASAQQPPAPPERTKRELATFLQQLCEAQPLILFFDDLHWADLSTIDLLSFLAGRLTHQRLLVIVAYRLSDLLQAEHPFPQIKRDWQTRGICRELTLDFLSHDEIAEYLTLEFPSHQFPPELAALIQAKTEGSPLFMTDLLCDLKTRGVIANQDGQWVAEPSLSGWTDELPESVRGMIERKIAQLTTADHRLLAACSVQGFEFDSPVIARALRLDTGEVEYALERLDQVHAFIRLAGEEELPDGSLTLRYRFVHVLYQNALYAALPATRRAAISGEVAQARLSFYGEHAGRIAVELAALFEAARDWAAASAHYLSAAHNAARLNAHAEALALAKRGLDALQKLPPAPERDRLELQLQLLFCLSLQTTGVWTSPEIEQAFSRAQQLCRRAGEDPQTFSALYGIWVYHLLRADYETALDLAAQLLSLAEKAEDSALLMAAHIALGTPLYCQGQLTAARQQYEQALGLYQSNQQQPQLSVMSEDLGVAAQRTWSWCMWMLGYPDQAIKRAEQAVARADHLDHPFSRCSAYFTAGVIHLLRREWTACEEKMNVAIQLAEEHEVGQMLAFAGINRDLALARQGQVEHGITQLQGLLGLYRMTGIGMWKTAYLAELAELCGFAGRAADGLEAIAEAMTAAERSGERYFEAELWRIKGDLLLQAGASNDQTESCYQESIAVARRQEASSWELRASISLARLWQQQGKIAEARHQLTEVYGRFAEGLNTAELTEASVLLENLRCLPNEKQ
ncbi:MAG TPA: AAA family ATPase [Blastocatellia bacterium]|nr:AAA family ATPase [Blastocatellia bacterium]HMV81948.1 AAA family ATPase [Blastocatellia bacterium]HMX24175.1 AAA family ATPase [Blastocatellia bacterium]HMY72325.1 AAA family ATPase [Blastocatellia bacterium]HMZ16358.1 AAA family ATPase [Blastocatellia bacterium]